jgi:hypothetical protein
LGASGLDEGALGFDGKTHEPTAKAEMQIHSIARRDMSTFTPSVTYLLLGDGGSNNCRLIALSAVGLDFRKGILIRVYFNLQPTGYPVGQRAPALLSNFRPEAIQRNFELG